MLTKLETIRLRQASVVGGHFDSLAAPGEYARTFREYGIDVGALTAEEAAARIRARAIGVPLASALDDWAVILRLFGPRGGEAGWQHLLAVADLPDLTGTRYEIESTVASGGMGTVYRARDRELDRIVALKVLHAPAGADLARRMLDEARILASLEHPAIVPVHDAGTLADGRVFYAMKYVDGPRLDRYLGDDHPLPDRLRVFERICEAVAFAHASFATATSPACERAAPRLSRTPATSASARGRIRSFRSGDPRTCTCGRCETSPTPW